jgi:hypothetical protein
MDEENLITPYLSFTDELNPFHTVGIRSSLLHQPLSFSGQTAVSNGCSNPSFDHLSCIYISYSGSFNRALLIHKCDYRSNNWIQVIHTSDNFGKKTKLKVNQNQARGDDVAN